MDATYFEGRLSVSIALMNAATDLGARRAHKGMVDRYRSLVTIKPAKLPRAQPDDVLGVALYSTKDALAVWADDGGSCGGFR